MFFTCDYVSNVCPETHHLKKKHEGQKELLENKLFLGKTREKNE